MLSAYCGFSYPAAYWPIGAVVPPPPVVVVVASQPEATQGTTFGYRRWHPENEPANEPERPTPAVRLPTRRRAKLPARTPVVVRTSAPLPDVPLMPSMDEEAIIRAFDLPALRLPSSDLPASGGVSMAAAKKRRDDENLKAATLAVMLLTEGS